MPKGRKRKRKSSHVSHPHKKKRKLEHKEETNSQQPEETIKKETNTTNPTQSHTKIHDKDNHFKSEDIKQDFQVKLEEEDFLSRNREVKETEDGSGDVQDVDIGGIDISKDLPDDKYLVLDENEMKESGDGEIDISKYLPDPKYLPPSRKVHHVGDDILDEFKKTGIVPSNSQLQKMRVKQLRTMYDLRGLTGGNHLNKRELIEKIISGKQKPSKRGKSYNNSTVIKALKNCGITEVDKISRCLFAAIGRSQISLSDKSSLHHIICSDICDGCGLTIEVDLNTVLYQPDVATGENSGPVECLECFTKYYITGMCTGEFHLTKQDHNHCTECKGCGTCIGDRTLRHCQLCGKHYKEDETCKCSRGEGYDPLGDL
eukprot:TRINITY_DN9453_c0_g1_i1.p1 TRINITY_DN9453_c0_g1~~TRINITY_DN9453_c0_g1_i1.p1  ORF type:complete len:383 (-),score=90.03 TRINITY_DN9453_c0_g1_i1:53-1171(-)